jgi:hypothetical protein
MGKLRKTVNQAGRVCGQLPFTLVSICFPKAVRSSCFGTSIENHMLVAVTQPTNMIPIIRDDAAADRGSRRSRRVAVLDSSHSQMIDSDQHQIPAHRPPARATSRRLDTSEAGYAGPGEALQLALQSKKRGVYTLSFGRNVFQCKPRPFLSLGRARR